MNPNTNSGFIALFFVLSFATALGFLVLMVSSKSAHMLSLFKSMRDAHIAKSSAEFCLQLLLHNKSINQGYRPTVGSIVTVSTDVYCVYQYFSEVSEAGIQTTIRSFDIQTATYTAYVANTIRKFTVTVLGVKKVGDYGQYYNEGQNAPSLQDIQYRLQKDYYITDSL